MGSSKKKIIISSKTKWSIFNHKEVFAYRGLILLLVKRDFVALYKQTVLGPLWFIIQPVVNTLVFTIIFGKIAKLPTNDLPPFLFYMSGTICWAYFASCLSSTSATFTKNQDIFSKVYFPRVVIPISQLIINILQFLIQFSIFVSFLIYYQYYGLEIKLDLSLILLPLLILQMAIISLGIGTLLSALTAKYRDLSYTLTFVIQLWMFATPIVYPLSMIPQEYRYLSILNPMTSVVESFRLIFFQNSVITLNEILLSICISIICLLFGLTIFNKVQKTFMDTV